MIHDAPRSIEEFFKVHCTDNCSKQHDDRNIHEVIKGRAKSERNKGNKGDENEDLYAIVNELRINDENVIKLT